MNECRKLGRRKGAGNGNLWVLVTSLDPRHSRVAEHVGKRSLELQRLPLLHRIEGLDEVGQQVHAEPFDRSTGLVA
jgi:hypothetical protein